MKKVLVAGAALMLAGGIAMPVLAADPGVSIKGDARGRIIYKDSYDYGNTQDKDSEFHMDSRLRFDVKGTAAGGAYVHARIRAIDNRFDGEASAALSTNIWADKAYLAIPMGDLFTFEIGKNRVAYGNGFIYDDIGGSGIRGIFKTDTVQFRPFFDIVAEGTLSTNPQDKLADNDVIRFGAVVDMNVNPDWLVGAMAAYQSDDRAALTTINPITGATTVTPAPDDEGLLATVFARGTMGAMGFAAELAYKESVFAGTKGIADDGFGGYVRPSYTMDAMTLSFDLGFTQDGFIADDFYGFVMIGGEWATQAMTFGEDGDWLWGAFSAKYQVSEDLFLVGNVVYADVDSTTPKGLSDVWELSGLMQYNFSPGANLQYRIGYLQPTYDNQEDDAAFGTVARFNISF